MIKSNIAGRDKYTFKSSEGGEVTLTVRESDYLLRYGEVICQCPKESIFISGWLDKFNPVESADHQGTLSLGMNDAERKLALMSISLDVSELDDVQNDELLKNLLNVSELDESDCVFLDENGEEIHSYTEYKTEHYFDNQTSFIANDIPFNPNLRWDFDNTPHEERDPLEMEHWWDKPYIVSTPYEPADASYKAYVDRIKSYGIDAEIRPESQWNEEQHKFKESWFNSFPSGIRFEVRMLCEGSWDRSTSKGFHGNIEDAISEALTFQS